MVVCLFVRNNVLWMSVIAHRHITIENTKKKLPSAYDWNGMVLSTSDTRRRALETLRHVFVLRGCDWMESMEKEICAQLHRYAPAHVCTFYISNCSLQWHSILFWTCYLNENQSSNRIDFKNFDHRYKLVISIFAISFIKRFSSFVWHSINYWNRKLSTYASLLCFVSFEVGACRFKAQTVSIELLNEFRRWPLRTIRQSRKEKKMRTVGMPRLYTFTLEYEIGILTIEERKKNRSGFDKTNGCDKKLKWHINH